MPKGKLSAQSGHAYLDSYIECLATDPATAASYRGGDGGTKVTIEARNLRQLERAARECAAAGIPHAIVVDRHHVLLPHFTGAPIVTALGIGPTTRERCRHVTKRFGAVR